MPSSTSRFSLKRTSHETTSSGSLAKVYMRNFGKGLLELTDNTLKFYTEKGRLSKIKELSKEFPLAEVESLTLEDKELVVTWKDTASRFVFEDAALAKQIYSKANESLTQPGETPKQPTLEELENVSKPQSEEPKAIDEFAEKSEVLPEQVQHEAPQTQQLQAQEAPPEDQKPDESSPAELQNQEMPEKREIPAVQEPEAAKVIYAEVPKEPKVVVNKSAAAPEIVPKPLEGRRNGEIAVAETKERDTSIVEQPTVAANLQKEKAHKPPEVQNINKAQENLNQALSVALSIVDSLFDVLRSMHGRVNWSFMYECEKRSEQDYERLVRKKIVKANLDFCFLSSALAEHNVELVSKEALHLLDSLHKGFEELPAENTPALDGSSNYLGAKVAVQTYYVLSDLFLAAVVGDEEVEDEVNQLITLLDNLSKVRKQPINVNEIIILVSKVKEGHGKETEIEELRKNFRKQLNPPK